METSISSSVKRFTGARALREVVPFNGHIKFKPVTQARLDAVILLQMLSCETWQNINMNRYVQAGAKRQDMMLY